MFITENQNVGDSVLFLLSSRTALANIVEASKIKNSKELISFIYNEASDYEIMHLLLKGSLPKKKYNAMAEMLLFSEFKQSMLMNKDFVTEMIGKDIFDNVLNEVDSLYMTTSTTRPVLEFTMNKDRDVAMACMIAEQTILSENPAQDAAKLKNLNAKLINLKTDISNATGAAKKALLDKYAAAKNQLLALKGKATAGAGGNAWNRGVMQKQATTGAKVKTAAGKAGSSIAKTAGKAGAAVSKFAHTPAGMAVGGAAAAALAIYAGAKIYKRFFSQAAKACAGQSGAAKTACMKKFKKQAIMKQAAAIQAASGTCAKSKDPAKCKAAVGKKVAALKAKAAAIAA